MAIADAWVSLVSTGGTRDFAWALREFTGGITRAHRIITRLNRGIISLHRGITTVHSSAARWGWRRIGNPVHAAFIKGVGDTPNRPDDPNNDNDSVFPGQAGLKPVPEPPQPQAKFRWRTSERLECEGGTEAQTSGLAHAQVRRSHTSPPSAHPPQLSGGRQSVTFSRGGPRGHNDHHVESDRVDDDKDDIDDRDSLAEAPVDRAFAHLIQYIYERFPHAEPQIAASVEPRCVYEIYFAVADPLEPSRKLMRLYPRVSEIQTAANAYAANLARESQPLFKILPSKRQSLSIGDVPDFCKQRFLNAEFSRICRSKSVP